MIWGGKVAGSNQLGAMVTGHAITASPVGVAWAIASRAAPNVSVTTSSRTIMAYPFTEPAVSPCTMYFWKIRTRSTAGTAARKPDAAMTE